MAVDSAGITRPGEVQTSTKGAYLANLVTVRTHAMLADGRTVQLMPGSDARAELPPDATVIWHERMGMSPQDVALAGSQPVDGSEITAKTAIGGGLDEHTLAVRLAGAETELRRLTELARGRLTGNALADVERQLEDVRKKIDTAPEPAPATPEENPNLPEPDPQKVRTAIKPSPAKP